MIASTSQPPIVKVPLDKQLIQVPLTHGRYVRYFSNASEMESACYEDEAIERRRCMRTTFEISVFILLLILIITGASIGMAHRKS
uniref:Ephrin RBD domain-containing protein n=1 Tax=Steinernema glaseri TaxID=37863 RepID=A0A1I8A8E6_9BILA